MSDVLLTPERITAASHICRWQGWVSRPYSILEHMNIGGFALRELGYGHTAVKAFLLHDLEETEFMGDIRKPDKNKYCTEEYYRDVVAWEKRLYAECGVELTGNIAEIVNTMDAAMLEAEWQTVSLRPRERSSPYTDGVVTFCRALIESDELSTPDMWWQLWTGTAPAMIGGAVT